MNHVAEPKTHAEVLIDGGLATDVWTATYLHVLRARTQCFDWLRCTVLPPLLAKLSASDIEEFSTQFAAELRRAYPARAERHAISGSPRVCRWTETLSCRYNSPPPHRNWQAHENAVASVATVLAMTPTEAAATATPVRVRLVIEGSCEMTRMGCQPP